MGEEKFVGLLYGNRRDRKGCGNRLGNVTDNGEGIGRESKESSIEDKDKGASDVMEKDRVYKGDNGGNGPEKN